MIIHRLVLGLCLGLAFIIEPLSAEPTTAKAVDNTPENSINGRYLLIDVETGRGVSNQDFRGRYQLISFGYTYCPDICPTTLANMAAIMESLGEDAALVQPIFITVDPERDTPAILRQYTAFFDKRIHGLTGTPEAVRRAADNFNVRYDKVITPGKPPDQYAIDHSTGMYLLGPDAQFILKFGYSASISDNAARLRTILRPE